KERTECQNDLNVYTNQLSSRQSILEVLKAELLEMKDKFGDERRTELTTRAVKSSIEEILETIPDEKVILSITNRGYVKRAPENSIVRQKRGNKGRVMTKLTDDDFVSQIFNVSTRDSVLLFTTRGFAHKVNVYD